MFLYTNPGSANPQHDRRRRALGFALAGALLLSACENADTPGVPAATASAIKERRDNYRRIGDAFKAIGDSIESGAADIALVREGARTIRDTGGRQAALFVPGSGIASGAKTRAREAVWIEGAAFAQRHQDFLAAADALVGAEPGEFGVRYQTLKDACLACHDTFRERR
jgi:cytochrome c556